jgi:DnaA family protein
MVDQLPLPFQLREDYALAQFVLGSNAPLVAELLALPAEFEAQTYWVQAAAGLGKTHLLQGCVAKLSAAGGRVAYVPARRIPSARVPAVLEGLEAFRVVFIDDLDVWLGDIGVEQELVRFYQELRSRAAHLVMSATQAPPTYEFALPDWRSRCLGAVVVGLSQLRESDRLLVLQRRAERLGLALDGKAGAYLLRHGARGLPDLLAALERLDRAALAEQRQLSIPFIKRVLAL